MLRGGHKQRLLVIGITGAFIDGAQSTLLLFKTAAADGDLQDHLAACSNKEFSASPYY
jgi:hypothetical protein